MNQFIGFYLCLSLGMAARLSARALPGARRGGVASVVEVTECPTLGKRLCVLLSRVSAACLGCRRETLTCDNGNQSAKEQIFISLHIDPGTGCLHVASLFCEMKLMVLL